MRKQNVDEISVKPILTSAKRPQTSNIFSKEKTELRGCKSPILL